jgi:uncharacterized protein YdaU (DUF1376 family)
MSGLPYFNKYAEDWLNGVRRMSPEQRGVYETLLCLMYASGREIDDDDAGNAHECFCSVRTYRRIKSELIALGKIWVVDGKIGNGRASNELAKQQQVRASYVTKGKKGAEARWSEREPAVDDTPPATAKPESLARSSGQSSGQSTPDQTPIKGPKSGEKHSENSVSPMAGPFQNGWQPELRTQNQIKENSPDTPEPRAGGPASPVNGAGPPGPRARKRTPPPTADPRPEDLAAHNARVLADLRAHAEAEAKLANLTPTPGDPLQ